MAMLRSAFMMNSVPGQVVCVGARGVYTSAMESVQSGTAKPATFAAFPAGLGENAQSCRQWQKGALNKKAPWQQVLKGLSMPIRL